MKTLLIMALSTIFSFAPQDVVKPTPEDFTIDVDKVENGIRHIEGTPSKLVCSKKIEIDVDAQTNVIQMVNYTGGCPGNLQAIKSLLKGLTVNQAVEKLDGIQCGKRGTSCTDQLSRMLKKAYNIE